MHSHPCEGCGTPTFCWGDLEANDDGWPLVRCVIYHLEGGQIDPDFLCESCREQADRKRRKDDPR